MTKIIKHFKPFIGAIIISFVLLFVQAIADLALPDYMSDIVNVGIQQNGIENAVPEVIRSSEFDKLVNFIDENDKNKVKDNYILLSKENLSDEEFNDYLKDYPKLNEENLYKLNTSDNAIIEDLNSIFSKSITIKSVVEEQGPEAIEAMKSNEADIPESMLTQGAVMYVQAEYENIGIDIEKLQSNYVILASIKMVGVALISMLSTVIVVYIAAKMAATLGKNLRKDTFEKVVDFSNAEFDEFSTASLITRTTNDIQQIQTLVVTSVRVIFYAPIIAVGATIKVLATGTSMGWVIGVVAVSIISLILILFVIAMPKFKRMQKLIDKLNLVSRESLTGMLVIRAFGKEKTEESKFKEANINLTKNNLFVNRVMAFMMPGMMLVMNGATLLIVWVGSHRINDGVLQVGDMMAFIQYSMQIIIAFLMITIVSVTLPRSLVSAQRINEILSKNVSIKDKKETKKFNNDENKGVVEFKNVSFKYPGSDENVLTDISFISKPDEITAFIGSTGSGKSTLVNLIPRFYDVTEGQILIDNLDIRDVTQKDLREKIGYVPQKGILFTGDIESNLKYGNENIKDEDFIKYTEISQSMEFIENKEDKFKTEISQGGTNVSGGQKQRLSIARALIKEPEILIFDDSFSALDFKTDSILRKSLKEEIKDTTMLIVAQRVSTIMHANQIIVLDDGKIVGKGTHRELLETCEVYKQIALSQLSKEELENE